MSTLPVFDTPSTVTPGLDPAWIARTVAVALDEDLGAAPGRDVTSQATIPPSATGVAELVAREDGVVAGLVVVQEVLDQVAARLGLEAPGVAFHAQDGDAVTAGRVLAVLTGRTQVLLVAERTLLNLASRASGVATATRAFARELAGTGARVLDTRMTTPGLRDLQK
ncbi:nicotinate-nucleotide diphosphorylase, partial [Streptomyces griseoincarnatus]